MARKIDATDDEESAKLVREAPFGNGGPNTIVTHERTSWSLRSAPVSWKVLTLILGVGIIALFGSKSKNSLSFSEDVEQKEQAVIDTSSTSSSEGVLPDNEPQENSADEPSSSAEESSWNTCKWAPGDHAPCTELLVARLPKPQQATLTSPQRQRWLFFGDTTMHKLNLYSKIHSRLIGDVLSKVQKQEPCWKSLECQQRRASRCHLNHLFGLPYAETWIQPDSSKFEGPTGNGLENHFCQDCDGCRSNFLQCTLKENDTVTDGDNDDTNKCSHDKKLVYGGYFSIEFARDVEIQTPQYKTTQENIALFLSESWSSKGALLDDWGLPICKLSGMITVCVCFFFVAFVLFDVLPLGKILYGSNVMTIVVVHFCQRRHFRWHT
jgi:hypothetical protein